MPFEPGDVLLHKKTARRYVVLIGAGLCRLEADGAPAYAYRLEGPAQAGDATVWVRSAHEMEDGRFELVGRTAS